MESIKNPQNGENGGAHSFDDDDDQEDLFVSTYDQPASKPTTESTTTSLPAFEDMMNTIDLNADSPASFTAAAAEEESNESSPVSAPIPISTVQSSTLDSAHLDNDLEDSVTELAEPKPASMSIDAPSIKLSSQQPQQQISGTELASAAAKSNNPSTSAASQIEIRVSDPHKVGEGMSSFVVYTVTTKTTLPYFRRQSLTVNRRFSDFLGLHSKLHEKHSHLGRIVPPPPSKSVVGTAKAKFGKQDDTQLPQSASASSSSAASSSLSFIEKRRHALERYLQRNAEHPIICADPDFREFLELETELPRSTSTSALSGAGVKRMFSFVSETVNKMTFHMDETDSWFEEKQNWIDQLDAQLRKLYESVSSLIHHRKELTTATGSLAKSTAILGNCEENNSLSCALSQLAATHEKVEKVYERQASNDVQCMAELLKDYIALIGSVRDVFHERVKAFQAWSTFEQNLSRKREQKNRLQLAMKQDRVPAIEEEIAELETKVEKAKEDFDHISANIKQEFDRFELNRVRDFKRNFIRYLEALLETQESLVECWESFLPESKSIAA